LRKIKIAPLIFIFFNVNICLAQTIEPKGDFIERQTKIGEPVYYSLSVRYEKNLNILFPDSTYSFGSFEYYSRSYFKTKTDDTNSFDSVVYQLATFELDSIQYLQLPVFIIEKDDSLEVYSTIDSLVITPILTEMPEKPELKANTNLVEINTQFNYPYLLIALGILAIILLITILFFGKHLLKAWKIFRMKRTHKKFIKQFFNLMRDTSSNNPSNKPEHVLAVWKIYLERLEKMPISKLTTKEILVLHSDEQLKNNLKLIDRSIYGGETGNDIFAAFDYLMKFCIEVYEQKIIDIKNG